jgi:hypothetical protein
MGRYIIKIKDYYLEWSTVVDAPITFGMTLDEFKGYYRDEYGKDAMRRLPGRLQRVEEKGISAHDLDGIESLGKFNRAGPDESTLTLDEIYQAYCLQEPIRDGWVVPAREG